jgi:hypothetical protein
MKRHPLNLQKRYTTHQVSRLLGLSVSAVRDLTHGPLDAHVVGRKLFITQGQLERFCRGGR